MLYCPRLNFALTRPFPLIGFQIITEPGSLEDLPCLVSFELSNRHANYRIFPEKGKHYLLRLRGVNRDFPLPPGRYNSAVQKLPRSFYDRDTTRVAMELLGKLLVHIELGTERIGKIVEVEAYLGPHDLAAHSSRGLTERTRVMFGPPGHAYVYFIYGMYHCLNVVTEREGHASAVLLRALAPVKNLDGRTSGPGLLCRAMHIDRRLNGHDLLSDDFFIAAPS